MVTTMLEFETPGGNIYAWDDEIGIFIPFSPTMKAVIDEIACEKFLSKIEIIGLLNDEFEEDEIIFCYDWIRKWNKIRPINYKSQITRRFDPSGIKHYILKFGLLHLTLCVTEDCNFRCKYCVYSNLYEFERDYSSNQMDFNIAKKAIDYYFMLLQEGERYNPLRKPVVGFYGGEPLLNFKLIKKCVIYI